MAWRSANGLSESRLIRLLAESTPATRPWSSTTGRWFTPASIIAMLASGASVSDGTVWTGRVMMELTGPSTDARCATTLSRRSTSVTMPSPSRASTSSAVMCRAAMSAAASAMLVSGAQKTGG